jgi:putative acetyltransferase
VSPLLHIVCDRPEHLADFIRLNEIWIQEHFSLESADRALAADPGSIARAGGHTLCAVEEGRVLGAVALFRHGDHFELARMAVAPDCRRRGIGRTLAIAAIGKAADRGARKIILLSNTVLAPAMALYRSLGFQVIRTGQHPEYARCNVVMEKMLVERASPFRPAAPVQVPEVAGFRADPGE